MRAVVYSRVSTQGQAQEGVSLDMQLAKAKAWAEYNGAEIVATLADEGISAKTYKNRPALLEALNMLQAGTADTLVVYKLDRLARSTLEAIQLAGMIEKAGGNLVSLCEKIDTSSAMGRFFFQIMAAIGELERGVLAERTAAAMQHMKAEGKRVSKLPPYGWSFENDKLIEDVAEQGVIGLMTHWYTKTPRCQALAKRLNGLAIPAKAGGQWHCETVKAVLVRAGVWQKRVSKAKQRAMRKPKYATYNTMKAERLARQEAVA